MKSLDFRLDLRSRLFLLPEPSIHKTICTHHHTMTEFIKKIYI